MFRISVPRLLAASLALLSSLAAAQPAVGPNFRVNTVMSGNQTLPAVAMHPAAGTFLVVWNSGGVARSQLFGVAGSLSGEERTVLDLGHNPAVAPSRNGGFVVVGNAGTQDGAAITARFVDSAGVASGSAFQVNDVTFGTKGFARVASDASGAFVVVWSAPIDGASAGDGVAARRFASTGAPIATQHRVNTTTTGHQRFASVARAPSGEFVVVWQSGPTQYGVCCAQIFGQRFASNGAAAGGEFRMAMPTSVGNYSPDVATDPAGDFVVVWQSRNLYGTIALGDNRNVHGQRYASSGVPVGPVFRVNAVTTGVSIQPRVTRSERGFMVVWSQYGVDGSGLASMAARFTSSGERVGNSGQTHFNFFGDQTSVVASSRASSFVVVWKGYDGGTHTSEIYAQRYCVNGDANGDGIVTVTDVFHLINFLFAGGAAPLGCADVNGSAAIDVTDVFYLINFLFAGGPPPV